MTATSIPLRRLCQQRLTYGPLATPAEVVGWLGAVQAQDYPGARWSLGLRVQNATDASIEQAFDEGSILRTHVMRPTWHFVTPADIRWMLELTAPRVHAASAFMCRQLELDDAVFARSNALLARALAGGRCLTRTELASELAHAGILAAGVRLTYIVMQAELDAIICSGPRRGKQFTYALLEERAPQARRLARDEALAELTRRYYTGHGPATVHDFSWWSGLTLADVKTGIDMVSSDLAHELIDGQTYWFSASMFPDAEPCPAALLLPTYDEFLIGYAGFDRSRKGGQQVDAVSPTNSTMLVGCQVAGSWKRTFEKGAVTVELLPFTPLSDSEVEAVSAAARRYASFLQMDVMIG